MRGRRGSKQVPGRARRKPRRRRHVSHSRARGYSENREHLRPVGGIRSRRTDAADRRSNQNGFVSARRNPVAVGAPRVQALPDWTSLHLDAPCARARTEASGGVTLRGRMLPTRPRGAVACTIWCNMTAPIPCSRSGRGQLGGDDAVVWPAAAVSAAGFALNAGLLKYLGRIERTRRLGE